MLKKFLNFFSFRGTFPSSAIRGNWARMAAVVPAPSAAAVLIISIHSACGSRFFCPPLPVLGPLYKVFSYFSASEMQEVWAA